MKSVRFSLPLLLAAATAVLADSTPPAPGTPADGLPEFEVLESRTERVVREEPAPLPDMQPVRKAVDVTVDVVKDPKIPEPEEPAPAAIDPEKAAAFRARMAARPRPVFLNLSAVVYDHECTRLRWRAKGAQGTPGTEYEAWSNVDWELLAGHGRIVHEGVEYQLFIALILEDPAARRRLAARFGKPYVPPPVPELPPDETPAFVVTQGDPADVTATASISALHAYFGEHRMDLVAAREARKEAQRQREAELRAHPPEPEDVHIRIWKKEPDPPSAGTRP